jgi:2-methylcitrate dehydratase PrpD
MGRERLRADDIAAVTAHVHQGALDVLGPVTDPQSVHQSKFSMGTVLALLALHGRAGLTDFDAHWQDAEVAAFRARVTMALDAEVDAAYPRRWIGKVSVRTTDGRIVEARIDEPKGDPGNTLERAEIEDKAQRLAAYRDGASRAEMTGAIARIRALRATPRVGTLLGGGAR